MERADRSARIWIESRVHLEWVAPERAAEVLARAV